MVRYLGHVSADKVFAILAEACAARSLASVLSAQETQTRFTKHLSDMASLFQSIGLDDWPFAIKTLVNSINGDHQYFARVLLERYPDIGNDHVLFRHVMSYTCQMLKAGNTSEVINSLHWYRQRYTALDESDPIFSFGKNALCYFLSFLLFVCGDSLAYEQKDNSIHSSRFPVFIWRIIQKIFENRFYLKTITPTMHVISLLE